MSDWNEHFLGQDQSGRLIEVQLVDGSTMTGRYHLEWEWENGEEVSYATIFTEDGEEHGCADWMVERWRLAKESKK